MRLFLATLLAAVLLPAFAAAASGLHTHQGIADNAASAANAQSSADAAQASADANALSIQQLQADVAALQQLHAPPPPLVPPIAEASVDCSAPDVVLQPGDSLRTAKNATPVGGVLGVAPGVHSGTNMDAWSDKDITICGMDPLDRPVIMMTGNISLNTSGSSIGRRLTLSNLEIVGGGIFVNAGSAETLTMVDVIVRDYGGDCLLTTEQTGFLAVVLQDVEVKGCGAGLKHNIYLSTRNGSVTALRVRSSDSGGSAFKALFESINIQFSTFEATDDLASDPAMWSVKLVDVPACSDVWIANNMLRAARTVGGAGTLHTIHLRARKTSTGCDLPPYGSPEFEDPAFWTDPNIRLFGTIIQDNTFERVDDWSTGVIRLVTNDGTYPRDEPWSGASCGIFKEVPVEWFERSSSEETGSVYVWPAADRYLLDFTENQCASPPSDPGAVYPPPARRHWVDGVEVF